MNLLFSATHTNETLSRWLEEEEEEASSETLAPRQITSTPTGVRKRDQAQTSEHAVVLQPLQRQMIVFLWMPQFHAGSTAMKKKQHGKSY